MLSGASPFAKIASIDQVAKRKKLRIPRFENSPSDSILNWCTPNSFSNAAPFFTKCKMVTAMTTNAESATGTEVAQLWELACVFAQHELVPQAIASLEVLPSSVEIRVLGCEDRLD